MCWLELLLVYCSVAGVVVTRSALFRNRCCFVPIALNHGCAVLIPNVLWQGGQRRYCSSNLFVHLPGSLHTNTLLVVANAITTTDTDETLRLMQGI
jgi:hypothetical protein